MADMEKHHADEWRRTIVSAGADESIAQQAVAMAALNGLFDPHRDLAAQRDTRWAVNVLLETIAAKFEGLDTWDIWRSDAASLVRGFKHPLGSNEQLEKGTS